MATAEVIEQTRPDMPPTIADAWAAVYIDVAEKLDAEERDRATVPSEPESNSTRQREASIPAAGAC